MAILNKKDADLSNPNGVLRGSLQRHSIEVIGQPFGESGPIAADKAGNRIVISEALMPVIPSLSDVWQYDFSSVYGPTDFAVREDEFAVVRWSAGSRLKTDIFESDDYRFFVLDHIPGIAWAITLVKDRDNEDPSIMKLALVPVYVWGVSNDALGTLKEVTQGARASIHHTTEALVSHKRVAVTEKASLAKEVIELRKSEGGSRDVAESYKLMFEYERAKSLVLEKQVAVLSAALTQYRTSSWDENDSRRLAFDGPAGHVPAENAFNHAVMGA
jgi:hypothetical protein